MRMVYFYIEKWSDRGLNKVSYRLDANDVFDFTDGKLTYTHYDNIPPKFWTLQEKASDNENNNYGVVDSISAIVGKNGSGKTTFASAMGSCFELGRREPTYMCIVVEEDRYVAMTNLENSIDDKQVRRELGSKYKLQSEKNGWSPHGPPFDLVYYSPFCSQQLVWPKIRKNMIDLSVTKYFFEFNNKDANCITEFNKHAKKISFEFVNQWINGKRHLQNYKTPIPLPQYVKIGGTYTAARDSQAIIIGMCRACAGNGETTLKVRWDYDLFLQMREVFFLYEYNFHN